MLFTLALLNNAPEYIKPTKRGFNQMSCNLHYVDLKLINIHVN